jgi:quercetin dioxygenase-like cupin family protein
MNLDKLNRWLTLGANIGVVFGLIIIIIEVRQNASLTRAALETTGVELTQNFLEQIIKPATAEVFARSITAPETLTPADIIILDNLLANQVQVWWQLILLEQEGLVPKSRVARAIANQAPYYFGSPFAKKWWEMETVGWEGTELRELADPIIRNIDPNFIVRRLEALRHPVVQGQPSKPVVPATDPAAVSPEFYNVLFDNQFIRVVEYSLPPGARDNPHTHPPKFMYVLEGGRLQITPEGEAPFIAVETAGHGGWSPARALHTAENIGEAAVRILLVEPKSAQEDAG